MYRPHKKPALSAGVERQILGVLDPMRYAPMDHDVRRGSTTEKEPAVSPACVNDTAVQIPPRGVEETRFAPRKPRRQKTATPNPTPKTNSSDVLDLPAISGSAAEPAGWVQKQIASLPPEALAALWDMFRNQSSGLPPETGQS